MPAAALLAAYRSDRWKVVVALGRRRWLVAQERVPSVVGVGRDVDGTDVEDRGLDVDDRIATDAVVHPQRPARGIQVPAVLGPHEDGVALVVQLVGPHRATADAMLVPALQRAAAAGAVVVDPRPLVVALGKLVEHARADRNERDL